MATQPQGRASRGQPIQVALAFAAVGFLLLACLPEPAVAARRAPMGDIEEAMKAHTHAKPRPRMPRRMDIPDIFGLDESGFAEILGNFPGEFEQPGHHGHGSYGYYGYGYYGYYGEHHQGGHYVDGHFEEWEYKWEDTFLLDGMGHPLHGVDLPGHGPHGPLDPMHGPGPLPTRRGMSELFDMGASGHHGPDEHGEHGELPDNQLDPNIDGPQPLFEDLFLSNHESRELPLASRPGYYGLYVGDGMGYYGVFGMGYYYGYGNTVNDYEAAADWFEALFAGEAYLQEKVSEQAYADLLQDIEDGNAVDVIQRMQ
ncbi:hypothetical protein GPECTOR_209g408 [Gonium pectorale]|uniref:Uncharacterized protein n=1 Tax=Gonium pectorale TaxID=33097 RepID=A0A150FYF0_GONPE|nr:hypothetical protein GPECTOR_209g408 [Gonium pectorale]|eukprot:KXZ42080.1 hypothetical protein GPECTOR_209g408 [Gonium pectorale]